MKAADVKLADTYIHGLLMQDLTFNHDVLRIVTQSLLCQ